MGISLETLACLEFVVRFIRALDARDYETVALSFAEYGIWHRGGEQLVGPIAVRAAMKKRPVDLETQHLVVNATVDLEADQAALVRYTLCAYAQTSDAPYHLHAIFMAEDRLVRTEDGWRFSVRSVEPAFQARPSQSQA